MDLVIRGGSVLYVPEYASGQQSIGPIVPVVVWASAQQSRIENMRCSDVASAHHSHSVMAPPEQNMSGHEMEEVHWEYPHRIQ